MKHQTRRIIALVMVLLLQAFVMVSASAATTTRNGLQLTLTTDKENYAAGESIQCTVDVVNNSQQELTVSYDVVLPEALELTAAERSALVVGSEESMSSSFTLVAAGKGADEVPSTGDNFPLAIAGVLFVAAAIVCFVLSKNKKRFMAMMLVFMLSFGLVQPLASTASAAEASSEDYEELAFQTEYTDELSEEEHERKLGEAEALVLASQKDDVVITAKTLDEFSLTETVMVDGQLATLRMNVIVSTAGDVDGVDKVTLGTVSLNPITILGRTKFFLKWAPVAGATHYEVWHLYNGSYIKKTTTTGLNYTTSYGVAGVINTYKVRAIKKSGNTVIAKGAYATRTCYGMDVPTLTSVGHTSSYSADVRIRWTAGSFCTGYHVYRSITGQTGTYKRIGGSTGLSFVDRYGNGYYKIRPYYNAKNGIQYMGPATTLKAMPAQYRALIIGQSYPTWSSGQLPGCLNDAQGMKDMLDTMTSPKYRPFDVKLRTNLTSDEILTEIKTSFQRAKANDVSVFYYSGHGTGPDGWLVGADAEYNYDYVTVDQLRQALDKIPGKKICIFDSCYSGQFINKAFGDDVTVVSDKEAVEGFNNAVIKAFSSGNSEKANLATSNYYVLTASSKYQTSNELIYGGTRFGMFTYKLLWGCGFNEIDDTFLNAMYADINSNGQLTLNELYNYTYSEVNSLAEDLNITQNVQVYPTYSSFVCWGK